MKKGAIYHMTLLSSFTLMKACDPKIHIVHFLCSGLSISQPLGLLGHVLLNFGIQSWQRKPLTSTVLLTNLSSILLSERFFSADAMLPLCLQETVNAGD